MVLFLVVVHAKSEYLVVKSSSSYQGVFDHFCAFCFGVSMLQSPGLWCPWERGLLGMLC